MKIFRHGVSDSLRRIVSGHPPRPLADDVASIGRNLVAQLNESPIRVGLLGAGTVGSQTARLIVEQKSELSARIGRPIELTGVACLDPKETEAFPWIDQSIVTTDTMSVATNSDIVIELIGGTTMASRIYAALGGASNVKSIENCTTRLRLVVNDTSLVDQDAIKKTGVPAVKVLDKTNLQVIVGTDVQFVADAMNDIAKGVTVGGDTAPKA